jgi:glycosyltransferase involved in cell wall biosynthesis
MKARVIHIITKLELGGAQQNTLYTVEHLDRERFAAALWAGDGGILNEEARRLDGVDFTVVPELVREVRPGADARALVRLTAMVKDEVRRSAGPVLVHTHSSKAGILGRWAAWRAGAAGVVHSFHGFGFNDFQRWPVKWAFIAAEWLTGRITDEFIAVSRANQERALALGLARPDRIRVIRSGIKLAEFARREIDAGAKKRELGLDPERPLALMVACLKPQKSPVDFVAVAAKVAAAVPEAQFALAGDGELRGVVEAAAEAAGLGDRLKLLGWRRDVAELMGSAQVLVLTSLWEGLPRVFPQAMAAGLPIVGTRVDGGPEAVVDGDNGWLLAPHDVEGMAARIAELLREPARARAMGAAGAKRVAEFDIDRMVREQEELYERMIAAKVARTIERNHE